MRKIFKHLCLLFFVVFLILTGCTGYTDEEIAEMRAKLASFENSQNFALSFFDTIWLAEKEVIVDELTYDGVKIDRLFGCADGYFYASTRNKNSDSKYTMHLLKVDYDTLEITEFALIENLEDSYTMSCDYKNGKFYFTDSNKYCVYDIETSEQEWFTYEHKEFWREDGRYSFDIKNFTVKITDNQTGEEKQVSWEKDLSTFEEGQYIQKFDQKFTGFVSATQRDGVCYLAGQIPLDGGLIYQQIVIFAYDFESGTLSYYGTAPYTEYNYPTLTIVNR